MIYRKLSAIASLVVILGFGASILPARGSEPFRVKDINPSAASSSPIGLTAVNGMLLFSADDGTHRPELWISNGTQAGTVMVRDINDVLGTNSDCCVAHAGVGCDDPTCEANVCAEATECCGGDNWEEHCADLASELCGTVCARGSAPNRLTDVNGLLFFSADDGIEFSNRELWMSDGTEAGTVMVMDIDLSGSSIPSLLVNVNGVLFFRADDGVNGFELWTSDGTPAGTVMVKDINPGAGGQAFVDGFASINGTLFFSAFDGGASGRELWRSDGTAPGTLMVKDIASGFLSSSPAELTNVDGTLFFRAPDGTKVGIELWKSDGTAAGTVMVKDIHPQFSAFIMPRELTNVNGMLFFTHNDGINGIELWRSDGTEAGTLMVKDINPGAGHTSFAELTNVNGIVFFLAGAVDANNAELWKSDGTEAGTLMVRDINPAGSSIPRSLLNVNGTLFFTATDGANGVELWMSDGTAAGTVMVADINPGVGSSRPGGLTNVSGTLFFSADDGTSGIELWALVVSADCNDNGIDDAEDIVNCALGDPACSDNNGNGIPDECDAHTPLTAAAPHDRKKNRYLSFDPNNPDIDVALQVTLTESLNHPGALGTSMWVGEPNADGIAQLMSTPLARLWPESTIHVTGCFISPVAEYEVRASIDEGATRSDPLLIDTIDQPGDGNFWGDTVGSFNGAEWSPSQGVTNIDDAVAVIKTWQQADGSPPSTVTDVEPQFINKVVNINDVFFVILAFQGDPYPFGCPDDPCQDTSAIPCP